MFDNVRATVKNVDMKGEKKFLHISGWDRKKVVMYSIFIHSDGRVEFRDTDSKDVLKPSKKRKPFEKLLEMFYNGEIKVTA